MRPVPLAWGVSRQGFGREPGDSCRKVALSRARLFWVCVTRCVSRLEKEMGWEEALLLVAGIFSSGKGREHTEGEIAQKKKKV